MGQKQLLFLVVCLWIIGCAPQRPEPIVPPLVLTGDSSSAATPTLVGTTVVSDDVTPMINQFGFVEPPTKPSESALLEWDVVGVERVTITRTGGQWGEAGQQWVVPPTGSMTHTFANTLGGHEVEYVLSAAGGISAEFTIDLACEYEWAFAHPTVVCPNAAQESIGMQQNFENGLMVWIETQGIVLFTSWNGQTHGVYEDTFDAAVDPVNEPSVTAPNGFYQPNNAFGKIWRDNDDVRAALGWAIGEPIGYNVLRQGETTSRTGFIQEYIGLHDGNWIFIDQAILAWDVTYPVPDIRWAGERPPTTFNDLTFRADEPTATTAGPTIAATAPPATAVVATTAPPPTAVAPTIVAPTAIAPTTVAQPTTTAIANATTAATATSVAQPTATIANSPTAVVSDGVTVHQFGFNRNPARPSDTVLLEWHISGVSSIHIERSGGEWGEASASYDLPARGSLEQTFDPEVGGWPVIYIVTSPDAPDFEYAVSTIMPCEWEWLFDFPYTGGGCPEQGVSSNGSMQTFERGFMIWVESLDIILYSTWNGLDNGRLPDNYVHGVDPINDASIVAPSGLFQPEYGFGKIWREQPGIRELLGWGTDWSRGYTALIQSEPFSRYGYVEYIQMNGGLITIDHPDPIWRIEYPR